MANTNPIEIVEEIARLSEQVEKLENELEAVAIGNRGAVEMLEGGRELISEVETLLGSGLSQGIKKRAADILGGM